MIAAPRLSVKAASGRVLSEWRVGGVGSCQTGCDLLRISQPTWSIDLDNSFCGVSTSTGKSGTRSQPVCHPPPETVPAPPATLEVAACGGERNSGWQDGRSS